MEEIEQALPFPLRGLDADNDAGFINHHLFHYCQQHGIQFTRGRPYKKDDNAHVEQKNWTHVRKFLGWDRYDSPAARDAINELYRGELRWMMNLFQPSVKLIRKVRVGARLTRHYDRPQTPLDRLLASSDTDPARLPALQQLRRRLDPFALAAAIERKLARVYRLATPQYRPRRRGPGTPPPRPLSRIERETFRDVARRLRMAVQMADLTPGELSVRTYVAR
ncbi:MAG: hypothetical protein ACT4PY_15025 [Armatimonadota bacterium]